MTYSIYSDLLLEEKLTLCKDIQKGNFVFITEFQILKSLEDAMYFQQRKYVLAVVYSFVFKKCLI